MRVGRPALNCLLGGFLMAGNTASKVFDLLKPCVEEKGLVLWDVRFLKEGATWYLRVFIDSEEGIGIEDCVEVHHAIDPILDEADPISQAYTLEVCSPGWERELTRPEHFEVMKGQKVRVKTIRPVDGRKEFEGILISGEGAVEIESEGNNISFAKDSISSVKLVEEI